MFAQHMGLLPNAMFTRMIEQAQRHPADFETHARSLFAAMRAGGLVGFERVEWFNGGLFDDDDALALEGGEVDEVLAAARLDWSEVNPSI